MNRAGRILTGIAVAAAAAVLMVLLIAVALFMIRPVRERLLDYAISAGGGAIPGDLKVERAHWPAPGTISVENAAWTDGPDTLAALESLEVSVDISELLSRDLHLRSLSALGIRADIAALTAAFEGGKTAETPAGGEQGGTPFPRKGSLPGLPSIAADSITLTAHRIDAPGGFDFRDLAIYAGVEARNGRSPSAVISHLSIGGTSTPLSVDSLYLAVDPAAYILKADGVVQLPRSNAAWLKASSSDDGTFRLSLTRSPGEAPPAATGIEISGRFERRGRDIEEVRLSARFLTPSVSDLAAFEALEGPLSDLGDLEGLAGRLEGRAEFSPFAASARLDITSSSWLDTLHVEGYHRPGISGLDTLLFGMPGLRIVSSGSLPPGPIDLSARIGVSGVEWIERIVPGMSAPEDLRADLSLRARDLEDDTGVGLQARGKAAAAGVSVDTLYVDATVPRDEGPYRIDLLAGSFDAALRTEAAINTGKRVIVDLSRPPGDAPGVEEVFLSGRLLYDTGSGLAEAEEIRLEGALGEWSIEGSVDSLRRTVFEMDAEWPAPPPLLRMALPAGSAAWDTLSAGWTRQGPFSLRASGSFEPGGDLPRIDAAASLLLPGPDLLAPFFLPGFPAEDLGPLALDLSAVPSTCGGTGSLVLGMDASPTGWLTAALAEVEVCADSVRIDTAAVFFEGIELEAGGSMAGGELDIEGSLVIPDSGAVRRIESIAGRELSISARGSVSVEGTASSPAVSARLDGRFFTPGFELPRFSLQGAYGERGLAISLRAREGLQAGPVAIDSLEAEWESSGDEPGIAPGRGRIEAAGLETRLLVTLDYDQDDHARTVTVDTLHAGFSGKTVSSRRPFIVSSRADTLSIEGMMIEGSAGRIEADGHVARRSADLEMQIDLVLPPKPRGLAIAERLWPGEVEASARLTGIWAGTIDGRVRRLTLGDGTRADILFEAGSDSSGASVSAAFVSPDDSLLTIVASMPPILAGSSASGNRLDAEIVFKGLPVPLNATSIRRESPDEIGLLSGTASAGGTFGAPSLAADLECRLRGGDELSKYRLLIDGEYPDTSGARSIDARLRLGKSSRSVLRAELVLPASLSIGSPWFSTGDSPMSLRIVSRGIGLDDLDPLFPPDMDMEGSFETEIELKGDPSNPDIDGFFRTGDMSAALADRARASIEADLALDGTLSGPSVDGRVTIVNALIRIPESSPELLPAEGDAVLWKAADSTFAAFDTAAVSVEETPGEEEPGIFEDLRFDVSVSIPGAFRIESERLSLELRGELQIVQKEERPALTGRLEPVRGRLLFMGRYFQINAGSVIFYGEDELNPSLDLSLTATVDEVDITIGLTGTADEPEIEISSDPQMDESDIMSLLLFGQRMDALDDSQTTLLQKRAAEVLAAFGAARLEQSLSKSLGVDMVTFQQSTRQPEQSALMLGKYINSRTLLKFEQGIENTANFLINLEYFITANLKVETSIDQSQETGIELKWTKEY